LCQLCLVELAPKVQNLYITQMSFSILFQRIKSVNKNLFMKGLNFAIRMKNEKIRVIYGT